MRVLGIETSCDDTAIAIYDSQQGLVADSIFSQKTHIDYGGVVPELASRDHLVKLVPLIKILLEEAKITPYDLNGIAYTAGPGLMGALLVGGAVAQTLGFAWEIPVIGIHHLEGHLLAPMLEEKQPNFPFVALLVSGGHTQLFKVSQLGCYELLGESLDDAAGEAFDKTAKLLGLPYPGGAPLAELAKEGDPKAFQFPRPLLNNNSLDFSFSGLKTHVANTIARHPRERQIFAHIAASFEAAVVDVLITKSLRALAHTGLNQLVIAGGVSANVSLRQTLSDLAQKQGFQIFYPRPRFCTDNGAMIAYAGCQRLLAGEHGDLTIPVRARWPLTELKAPDFL